MRHLQVIKANDRGHRFSYLASVRAQPKPNAPKASSCIDSAMFGKTDAIEHAKEVHKQDWSLLLTTSPRHRILYAPAPLGPSLGYANQHILSMLWLATVPPPISNAIEHLTSHKVALTTLDSCWAKATLQIVAPNQCRIGLSKGLRRISQAHECPC